jgi:outer membrane lipoprotein-sorting protein
MEPGPGQALVLDGDRTFAGLSLVRLQDDRGPALRRVLLDRETLRPAAVLTYDPGGVLLREVSYADWREGAPRRVTVARPQQGYEAEFALEEVEVNVALPERAFEERPAEGYKLVEVGAEG